MEKLNNIARLFVLSAGMLCAVSCGNSGSGGEGGGSSVDQSTSLNPIVQYTVRFNPCGGSSVAKKIVLAGSQIATAPSTNRPGYTFLGWCTDYDGTQGTAGTEVGFPYTVNGSVMLYARWQKAEKQKHTPEEIAAYMDGLKSTSEKDHLYVHYYRFDQDKDTVGGESYSPWDVWAWPMYPDAGEGVRFDWKGRTRPDPNKEATGTAEFDSFGGAVADIDLTKTYDGGWDNDLRTIGGHQVSFYDKKGNLDTKVGIQIVKSDTRTNPEGEFWTNDGGDQPIDLTGDRVHVVDVEGGKAYHVFALQEKVASYQASVITDISDPFDGDKGEKVTRGKDMYSDVNWDSQYKYSKDGAVMPTAPDFASSVGVGYQIQVATFADSDGDGYGDLYGIEQKLGYLKKLGVKALWLTPVQKSDSYHGYDIIDYGKVDEKFGSSTSPNAVGGKKTDESAMADYLSLIEKAHQNGMKVIMDLVLNHTSTSNVWFINSAQLNPDYRAYYQWGNNKSDPIVKEVNCWFPYGDHDYSYYAKFGSSMPELNYQYQRTRDAVVDMTLEWCKKGVDGYRLDAVKHVFMSDEVGAGAKDSIVNDIVRYEQDVYADVVNPKTGVTEKKKIHSKGDVKANYTSNLSKNLHFYRELNARVKAKYPNAFFVGENFDGNAYNVSPWYSAFDSMFDFYGYFNLTTAAAKIGPNAGSIGGGNTFDKFITGGGPFTITSGGDKGLSDNAGIYNGVAGTYKWDLGSVINSYNYYHKGKAMPGFFTSNHDIARVINRVAGTQYDSNGLTEQGKITTQNYGEFRRLADLVKATEILLPGCTWIYYGDEIGMTGNFPAKDASNKPFTHESSYADLYWRQPMKWKQGGEIGDGSMTTGLAVTGSGKTIEWDEVNKTSTVVDAQTQMNNSNSQFNNLAKVVAFKNSHPAMITGQITSSGSTSKVWKFNNGGIDVVINFNDFTVTAGGSKIASF